MDISTAYKQQQQIINLHEQIAEVRKELKQVDLAYKLAFVGTFVLYFAFVWMMYVADLWGFTTWLTRNFSEIAALIVFGVLSVALPLTMALIKEIGYQHFSTYPNPLYLVVVIVGILAMAGVVYESIVSSSQQQHISHNNAENSKSFQAISQSGTATIETGSMASLIAAAQQQVARCEEKLKAGKEKHCEGDKAKLHGYLDAEQRAMDSAEKASIAAIEAKTSAIQELKEDAFKPVFKSIRDSFGVSINTGIMLVTMFISIIFEISHLLLILFGGQKRKRLEGLKQALIQTESSYLQSTGKKFNPDDFKDESVLDLDDLRQQEPQRQPVGFGQPATAFYGSPVRFKYQEPQRTGVGFIDTNNIPTPPKNANQVQNKAQNHAPELSTWNAELSKMGVASPADNLMNQTADKAQIERIVRRGQSVTPDTGQPTSQLGIPSQSSDTSQLDSQLKAIADKLYPAWRDAVKNRQITHAKAATQKFIWKHYGKGKETPTANEAARIWAEWKSRGKGDGLLKLNPKYQPGNRKPEFILA